MIRTKSIRIWTLVTHAMIIIGMGHGLIPLAMVEAISLAALIKPVLTDEGDIFKLFGVFSFVGQVAIVMSFYVKAKRSGLVMHMSGLFFLWSSLIIFAYGIRNVASNWGGSVDSNHQVNKL